MIPTRGRETRLALALAALAEQTLERSRFEVVVVRDSDAEAAPGPTPEGLAVRFLRIDRVAGPAPKRNLGWREAGGPFIAFLDDDCRPMPDWLERLLAAHAGDSQRIVQGRTVPDPDEIHLLGPFSHTRVVGGPAGLYETCNISYPREVLERVDGFDETFERACGEDVDLGWRARAAGAGFAFEVDAVARHAVTNPGLEGNLRAAIGWIDAVRVVRDHPELRSMLTARLFWKPSHPRLLAGMVLTAVAIRRRAVLPALLALVPWALHHHRREDVRGLGLRHLPQQALIDACEIATMAAGSVRYRSPML